MGLGSAGEGLGMHWGAIKLLYYMTLLLNCQAKTTPKTAKGMGQVELGRAALLGGAGWGWVGLRGAE